MHFIGIDIGTSSICGVIYNFSDKKIESITQNNQAAVESSNSWEKVQDPAIIIETVIRIIRDFTSKYTDIKGIGITGQMHGILYVNEEGDAVSPFYTWQDGRGNLRHNEDKTYAEYLSSVTNHALSTGFGLATHFYNQCNNLIPPDAVKLCTIMDYAVMKLSGKKTPLTDYSNGASLGIFDKQNLRFDIQALKNAGIDSSFLPECTESATFAGYYDRIIPVYSAIGDNQASFLGSVSEISKSIHVTVGTSSQISIFSDKFIEIASVDTRPFPGGGYILVGAALCGGQSFEILKNFFTKVLTFFKKDGDSDTDIYKIMTSISYNNTDKKELPVINTTFDGTRLSPYERGSISNISTFNLTPENLIIGFLKGISKELYNFYDLIPDTIKKHKTILIGSGNGLKKNSLLCKSFEEQFGCQLQASGLQEESAFGACICSIVGGKYIENFHQAGTLHGCFL